MKYGVFWEFSPEGLETALEKAGKVTEERAKMQRRFPKILYPPHTTPGGFKGFTMAEVDEPGQMPNTTARMTPEMKGEHKPVIDAQKRIEPPQEKRINWYTTQSVTNER